MVECGMVSESNGKIVLRMRCGNKVGIVPIYLYYGDWDEKFDGLEKWI